MNSILIEMYNVHIIKSKLTLKYNGVSVTAKNNEVSETRSIRIP